MEDLLYDSGLSISVGSSMRFISVAEEFGQTQSPNKHCDCRYDTQSQRNTPDRAEMILFEDPEEYERDKCGHDESKIDHGVCMKYSIFR
jgi:hypothetical protein